MSPSLGEYEVVVGLEVHAQLLTRTKLFCGCETSFGDPPNTHVCPVCLGLPGALPVLNGEAVRMASRAALALSCALAESSVFARKNYFYPDLPKGYQISQFDRPLASHGGLEIDVAGGSKRVGILRVQMEEDAGKTLHGHGSESIVDLNRAGTPLIEIVGDPDLRSGAEAAEYLKRLREALMFLGVTDGNLEQGSFRCDANVSVRKVGETKLGTRTELKNINSFRFVSEAIEVEARRQIAALEAGERVRQQTRGYNDVRRETYLLRDKENEAGYRYFPEPDLPPLVLDEGFVAGVRASLPRAPQELRRHLVEQLGLTAYSAAVVVSHPRIAAFFEEAAGGHPALAVKTANFILSEVLRDVEPRGLTADFPVTPGQIAEIIELVEAGTISGKQAKEIYAKVKGSSASPVDVVRELGMRVVTDEAALEAMARRLVEASPKQAAGYRAGKANLLGFFVGQMMKETRGSASPQVVNEVLKRVLAGEERPSTEPPMTAEPEAMRAPSLESAALARGGATFMDSLIPSALESSLGMPPLGDAGDARVDREVETPHGPPAGVHLKATPPPASPVGPRSPIADSVIPQPLTLHSGMALFHVPGPSAAPVIPVPFSTLASLGLRVGVIESATRLHNPAALVELLVNVGEAAPRRMRAILAAAAESLVGQRVVVACNVEVPGPEDEPRTMGVLLVVGAVPLTVPFQVPPGAQVE